MPTSDGTTASNIGRVRGEPRGTLPKLFGRWLIAGVVGGIVVAGLAASLVMYGQAERIAEDQEAALTTRATRILQSASESLLASLAGASAIVDPSGDVDEQRFSAFAAGSVSSTLLPVLAYIEVVADADRSAFVEATGRDITQIDENGALTPAQRRDSYLAVRSVYPPAEPSNSVIGFDITSEPVRAAAADTARDSGVAVFSAPITSQPSGQPGFFAIQPLYRPGEPLATVAERRAAFAGFVSSLAPARTILSEIVDQLPAGAKVGISDDGHPLAGTPSLPRRGHRLTDIEAGRLWTVAVEYHDADLLTVWLVAATTLLLAAAVGLFLWRNLRQTAALREAALGVRQLGLLSEELATADSRDQVVAVILETAMTTVGAASVAVALPSTEPGRLVVARSGAASDDHEELVITEPSPITDAWNTRNAVFVEDDAAFRGLYADGALDRSARTVSSVAALPLRRPNGDILGVLSWEWPVATRFGEGVRSTLQSTAEVCQQSLSRADLREQQWSSASALSALSQRLAVARNIGQIAKAVIELAPGAGGADFVGVGFLDGSATTFDLFHPAGPNTHAEHTEFPVSPNGALMAVLRRGQPIEFQSAEQLERFPALVGMLSVDMRRLVCIPLIDSEAELRGVIAFVFATGSRLTVEPEAGRLNTIAELTAQTVERAMLYLHEHELVVDLQRQTLADLPNVSGLDIAARYLPSSATLGLGGDWYDVYELGDGKVGMVVGDVSGHGIDAIADMTEFRTTISTLLRTDHELSRMPAVSTALLKAGDATDVRFATAGLMVLDMTNGVLSYVRAGHPPMLVRRPNGHIALLEGGGGGPIGIVDTDIAVQSLEVSSGSVIVAYTDGLIERREESLDTGLERLRRAVAECPPSSSAEAVADAIVKECLGDRQTDDDTALLVVVMR